LFSLIGIYLIFAIGTYFLILIIGRHQSYKLSLIATILLAFFNSYGLFFNLLNNQNVVEVEHFFFLPLFLLIGFSLTFLTSKMDENSANNIWRISLIVSIFLVSINIIRIVPIEVKKFNRKNRESSPVTEEENLKPDRPDIYYIIFDEFVGFEAMRDYWQNSNVEDSVNYLLEKGFFVAEDSHSTNNTGDTLHQMAMRLNYQYYPDGSEKEIFYEVIVDNQVMKLLKENGYQTITFDETSGQFGYPARGPIHADINYEDDPTIDTYDKVIIFDSFGKLVKDNSILSAVSGFDKIAYSGLEQHKNMISFTVNEIGNIERETPVFVYVHLLFPHAPFMFDEHGHYIEQSYHTNWDYYLGNYNFSMKMLQRIVDNILVNYGPENQPIIILQSDHGARNSPSENPDDPMLENYPDQYKSLILNALYLPYCEEAPLTQDMDPINTFPIIFNCLFDSGIPIK